MAYSSLTSDASTVPAHVRYGEPSPQGSTDGEPDLQTVPASALGVSVRDKIAWYLDPESELTKNWEHLAEALGYAWLDQQNWKRRGSPTKALLESWSMKEGSTVGGLLDKLTMIERDDLITDHGHMFVEDAKKWIEKRREEKTRVQVPEVSSVSGLTTFSDDAQGLTLRDGLDGQVEKFDAYVCYCPEDMPFIKEMMRVLEGDEYNLKLFINERDLLPGVCSTTAMAELIRNRCRRMVVVLSPSFHEHELNNFCIKFGISLQPGGQSKRVVPIFATPCSMPPIMHHLTALDYTRIELRHWFWPRLHKAITLPL